MSVVAAAGAAAGVETGSGKPKTDKVGKVTKAQVEVSCSLTGGAWGELSFSCLCCTFRPLPARAFSLFS